MKLITRCREWERPAWWQGRCYFDYTRNEAVMAPIGLHLVIRAWWGFCLRYYLWAWGPCLLDETISEALALKAANARLEWELGIERKRVAAHRMQLIKHLEEKSKGGAA